MSEIRLTRSSSLAVISPIGYSSRYNDVNTRLEYPEMYDLRRTSSVPEILSRSYFLGRTYTPDAYRYHRDWGLFGSYSYDRRRLTDSVYEPYYAWPLRPYTPLDPVHGVYQPYTRWEYPRRPRHPIENRVHDSYWQPYWRWKRLQSPWIDDPTPIEAEGALKAYRQRLISRDSYLKDYWMTPYSWELRYSDYQNAYNPYRPYASYRPHYYFHYMRY